MSISAVSGSSSLFSTPSASSTSSAQEKDESYIDVLIEERKEQKETRAAEQKAAQKSEQQAEYRQSDSQDKISLSKEAQSYFQALMTDEK